MPENKSAMKDMKFNESVLEDQNIFTIVSDDQFSPHARRRAQQRSVSRDAIAFAIAFGKRVRRRGAIFFYLGKRHIPAEYKKDPSIRRWEGTTVIMSSDESTIMTVYRNRSGLAAA